MTTNFTSMKTLRAEVSAKALNPTNTTRVLSALVLATGIVAGLRSSHMNVPSFPQSVAQSAAIAPQKVSRAEGSYR